MQEGLHTSLLCPAFNGRLHCAGACIDQHAVQGILQMEPLVMEAISWAFKPTLQSVHPQEPQVLAWRGSIASTLTAALYPARQYIAKVQAYESWLALDPTAYVEALQVSNP